MSNILLRWLEIELSSTVTKRYAISGWPITYDGNTYNNDGTLISTGDLKFVLDLENTPFEVTLSLTDTDVLNAINDLTYRYRDATLYVGMWDSSNSQIDTDTIKIKNGYVDTHADPTADHTVTFTISSYVNLASQTRTDISASAAHRIKLLDGVFGDSNKNVTDTVFDSVNRDFSQIVLGNIKATSSRIQIGGARPCSRADHWFGSDPIYQTVNTPSSAGVRLENVGELYHTPVAYGKVKVNDQIVNAWNPTESAVTSTYNTVTWNTSTVLANVEASTKYLSIAYVVAHGPVDSVDMYSNHSDATYPILTAGGGDIQTTYIYANDNTSQGVIAAIDCSRGTFDQTAMPNPIATANGSWDSNDRGIGYCLVVVTMLASDQWPDGLPEFTFIVDSTRIKAITAGGAAATRSKTNGAGEVIYDFMTSAQYGMDLPETFFEVDSFHDFQANAPAIYPNNLRGSVTGPGSYTRFLERMQQSAAVRIYEEDGKIRLWYGEVLDDSDIAKEFIQDGTTSTNCVISQRNPRSRTVLNECRGRYFALFDATDELPDNLQKTVIITDTDYLNQDNNIKSTATLDLDFLTLDGDGDGFVDDADKVLVEQVTNLKLQKSRFFQEVIITTDYDTASGLKLGDLVRCDVSRYGWEGANRRLFIIREIVYGQGGSVELTCQRHSNTVYGGVDSFSNLDIENQFPVRTNNIVNINDYAPTIDGQAQIRLQIYRRLNETPDTPTDGSYNFATQEFTPPAGWFELPPEGGGNLYISNGTAFSASFSGTDSDIEWTDPELLVLSSAATEIIVRLHSNNVDDDPGPPSGEDGLGGGWVEDTDDPHWEAITEAEVLSSSPRTIQFDFEGVGGDGVTNKEVDTEQIFEFDVAGMAGDSELQPAQNKIVEFPMSGRTANSELPLQAAEGWVLDNVQQLDNFAFNPRIGNSHIGFDNGGNVRFTIYVDTPGNAGTYTGIDIDSGTNSLTTSAFITDIVSATYPDGLTVELTKDSEVEVPQAIVDYYDESATLKLPSYGSNGSIQMHAWDASDGEYQLESSFADDLGSAELTNSRLFIPSTDDMAYTEIRDNVIDAIDSDKHYVINIWSDSDGVVHDAVSMSVYGYDFVEGGFYVYGDRYYHNEPSGSDSDVYLRGTTAAIRPLAGSSISDVKFAYPRSTGSFVRAAKFTYANTDTEYLAPYVSFTGGASSSARDSVVTTPLTVPSTATGTAGDHTQVTVTYNGTSKTFEVVGKVEAGTVAGNMLSIINNDDVFSQVVEAAVDQTNDALELTYLIDTDSEVSFSVTGGDNSSLAVGDTDNNFSIDDQVLIQAGMDSVNIGGSKGQITISFEDSDYLTYSISGSAIEVATDLVTRINNDPDDRYNATRVGSVVTATAEFEGTTETINVVVDDPGTNVENEEETLTITRITVEDGRIVKEVGDPASFTLTVGGVVQIQDSEFQDAATAAQMAATVNSSINALDGRYTSAVSGDILTATSDTDGFVEDINITISPGTDTDGDPATADVIKTVIDNGGESRVDLTDNVWRYFVINQETRIDTDLIEMDSSTNRLTIKRGLILDSTALNATADIHPATQVNTNYVIDSELAITDPTRNIEIVFTGSVSYFATLVNTTDAIVVNIEVEYTTDSGDNWTMFGSDPDVSTFTKPDIHLERSGVSAGEQVYITAPLVGTLKLDPNTTWGIRARLTTDSSSDQNIGQYVGNPSWTVLFLEELRA